MKKTSVLFILALLLVGFSTSYTQTIGVKAGLRLPMSDFKDFSKTGYGISAEYNFTLPAAPVEFSITGSWDSFGFSDAFKAVAGDYKFTSIGVMGGARYLIKAPGIQFTPYVGAKLGYVNFKNGAPGGSSSGQFAWSPEVGFRYGFSPITSLDVNVAYLSSSKNSFTSSWLGISAGVVFGL
jgi:hypothetical protein